MPYVVIANHSGIQSDRETSVVLTTNNAQKAVQTARTIGLLGYTFKEEPRQGVRIVRIFDEHPYGPEETASGPTVVYRRPIHGNTVGEEWFEERFKNIFDPPKKERKPVTKEAAAT